MTAYAMAVWPEGRTDLDGAGRDITARAMYLAELAREASHADPTAPHGNGTTTADLLAVEGAYRAAALVLDVADLLASIGTTDEQLGRALRHVSRKRGALM